MIAPVNPSNAEGNGRDKKGLFQPGNKIGKGNPYLKRVHNLRAALIKSVTTDDMREVVAALLEKAKSGDVPAIKELLDRTIGKPAQQVEISTAPDSEFTLPPTREGLQSLLDNRAGQLSTLKPPGV